MRALTTTFDAYHHGGRRGRWPPRPLRAQTLRCPAADTDWPIYGGNLANWRYAPLDQINAANFNKLEVAWRFKTDNLGTAPGISSCNPRRW